MKIKYYCIFIFFSLIILSCQIDEYTPPVLTEEEKEELKNMPFYTAEDIKVIIYDENGSVSATVYGDFAEFRQNDEIFIENMKSLFQMKEDNEIKHTELISDYGKIIKRKNIEAYGNVVLIRKNEFRLETDKIFMIDENEAKGSILKTEKDKLVTIYYADGSIVKGYNGVWKQKTNQLTLEKAYTESENKNNVKKMFAN